jgi:hypothetical protein
MVLQLLILFLTKLLTFGPLPSKGLFAQLLLLLLLPPPQLLFVQLLLLGPHWNLSKYLRVLRQRQGARWNHRASSLCSSQAPSVILEHNAA